jgi:6-phosphogluconate dehydrogenase
VAALRTPRVLMLLVPAGEAVDQVIAEFAPLLQTGDFIVDAGNSLYRDSMRRAVDLQASGVGFIGMGVSGGESGARYGPSMMPGGSAEDYQRLQPILESVAARFAGEPCVARMGDGAAGHYVKMIHNGIEYALMQMLAESYDLMKRRLGMDNAAMAAEFARWNQGRLQSYLVEITASVLRQPDDLGDGDLLDAIADRAASKGTGKWSSQDAMDLGVPVPGIDAAVAARALSALHAQRQRAAALYPQAIVQREDRALILARIEEGYHAAAWLAYAQGFSQIAAASQEFGFGCDLASVARVWRAGCIIRAAMLGPMHAAFAGNPSLPNLLLDPAIAGTVAGSIEGLRRTVADACVAGVPVPALSASLAWFDGYRSARLPSNLIQAQRDLFGAHTYQRLDREGSFHTLWSQS